MPEPGGIMSPGIGGWAGGRIWPPLCESITISSLRASTSWAWSCTSWMSLCLSCISAFLTPLNSPPWILIGYMCRYTHSESTFVFPWHNSYMAGAVQKVTYRVYWTQRFRVCVIGRFSAHTRVPHEQDNLMSGTPHLHQFPTDHECFRIFLSNGFTQIGLSNLIPPNCIP